MKHCVLFHRFAYMNFVFKLLCRIKLILIFAFLIETNYVCFFIEAVEQLRENLDDLEHIGAENDDIEFLRQILEDHSLINIIDVC